MDDDWPALKPCRTYTTGSTRMEPQPYTGDPSFRVYDGTACGKPAAVAVPPQFNRASVTEDQFAAGVEALIVAQRQHHETPAGQLRAALAAMNIGAPA